MDAARRRLLGLAAPAAAAALAPARPADAAPPDLPPAIEALSDGTAGASPIAVDEHRARIVRAQRLLQENGFDALVVGPGTGLAYFTGAVWGLSERFFGAVITREGDPSWVVPAFESARGAEQIRVGTDVRAWEEHESPYALLAQVLRDRRATGRVAVDEALPFAFADGLAQALPAARVESGVPVTAGCRMIKSPHEVALMRRANEITVRAWRAVFASLRPGLTQDAVAGWCREALRRQGMGGGALVLFGADAAFPHGTTKPQPLRSGEVVLIDGGGRLHGYASDITRTGVFGARPTDRQRRIWDLVRSAQDAAFKAARPGAPCESVDAAARAVLADGGFGPEYKYLTHRVGHGIGMDGHEWTYLVRGNQTPLRPGMCFSDEPGIYVPGELGIRHEDIIVITEGGAENLTKWSGTPEEPAVV
jgi:Xaa-Pro aminopeptidase